LKARDSVDSIHSNNDGKAARIGLSQRLEKLSNGVKCTLGVAIEGGSAAITCMSLASFSVRPSTTRTAPKNARSRLWETDSEKVLNVTARHHELLSYLLTHSRCKLRRPHEISR